MHAIGGIILNYFLHTQNPQAVQRHQIFKSSQISSAAGGKGGRDGSLWLNKHFSIIDFVIAVEICQ